MMTRGGFGKSPVAMILMLILIFSLSGCGAMSAVDEGLKDHKKKADDEYWTERNVPPVDLEMEVSVPGNEASFDVDKRVSRCVYKYLEDGDKKMLKKMFARTVIKKNDQLDGDIDRLMEFYDSLEVDGYEIESNSRYRSHKVEPLVDIIEYTYHTRFYYEGDEYILDILFVRDSNPDEDLLGIHGISLRKRGTDKKIVVNTIDVDI